MPLQKAVIIINPNCHQGKGWKRWLSVRSAVRQRLPADCTEMLVEKGVTLKEVLHPHWQQDEKFLLLSAGGDGTVHYLVNYLFKEEKAQQVILGAIGLGSSNDFLKPFGEIIKGIPVRIHHDGEFLLHDAGLATFRDENNVAKQKYFMVNASVGVTAAANWSFNHPDAFLRFLKKRASNAAIAYTAISTIFGYRNIPLSLQYNAQHLNATVSNINILKVPYVSGSFYYRQPVQRDDGRLGVNVCLDLSKTELLSVLRQLRKGNFPVTDKTITAFTTGISISASQHFVFECDGETEQTQSLQLGILPNAISVLKF